MKITTSIMALLAMFSSACWADDVFIPINGKMASPKTLNAMVHFPQNYDANRAEGYPLLIAFHGFGKCDDATIDNGDGTYSLNLSTLGKAVSEGAPKLIRDGVWDDSLPFIVLAPQVPLSPNNTCNMFKARYEMIYNHAVANFNVDRDRVYVTGLSQGGNAVYTIIADRPDTIAAAVPIAAWYPKTFNCEAINHVAVWAFHGDSDANPGTGHNSGISVVDKKLNGCADQGLPLEYPAKLTSFAGVPHNAWDGAYGLHEYHIFRDQNGNPLYSKHYYLELAYDHSDSNVNAAGNYGGDGYYYHYNEFGRYVVYHWLLSFSRDTDTGPNRPPEFNPVDDVAVIEGETLTFDISAIDPDGDEVDLQMLSQAQPFLSFVDNQNGTATISLSPEVGDRGSYTLSVLATDVHGAIDQLDLTVVIEAAQAGDGVFLRLTGSNVGWNQFRLFKDGLWTGDHDLLAMGHDTLVVYFRNLSPIPSQKLFVHTSDAVNQRDEGVDVADYAAIGSDWVRVDIPMSVFGDLGVDLHHFRSFRLLVGPNSAVDLALDEIKFVGGPEPFVLFGRQHQSSAYKTNGNLSAHIASGDGVGD